MILVYGLKKSGISITKLFKKKKIDFRIWDDSSEVRKNLKKNHNTKKLFINSISQNLNNFDQIFVSPGISLRDKKFKDKSSLKRDLNLYLANIKKEKIIAITGTNGKSTTTKLIGDLLIENKINTFIGGNIGKPLCDSLISKKNYDYHVVELSSFQLETVKDINTKISIITNLAQDHLDRYINIKDYIKQKKNIITKDGINLISIDDKHSRKIFFNKQIKNKISFSIIDKTANFYMENNLILDNYFKKNKKIYINKVSKSLEGNFNNQNILIAYICSKLLKLPEKYFLNTIKKFKGLPFRSEIIFDNKKIKVINNSKSTNINSTINSINNYKNIYLILGGIAKEKNFEVFAKYKKNINCIYVFGSSADFIENQLKKSIKIKKFKKLQFLVKEVFNDIKNNNSKLVILFAPACTSFDQFKNFEERGKVFTKLINQNLKKL